ncbi:MAG: adenosylmethionine--8-amino-7-oxononanoate transaminase [Longimicrobiales bacterium]
MTQPDWLPFDGKHVWHPYTQHGSSPPPVPIERAQGASLYDVNGRAIIDAISSWWVILHGHCEPAIASAIAEQATTLDQVIFAGFTHEPAARLAQALCHRLSPPLERVFLSDNGSTAVEVALKMAIQYWALRGQPKNLIAALHNGYHGDTFGAMSASSRGLFTRPFEAHLFQVARLPDPSTEDVVAAFQDLIETRGRELAAIIVEPLLLGAGGMRPWSADSLQEIQRIARTHRVLLIADEVLTGFGRTGPLFASLAADVVPDIICLSKGLTGGFLPLGATVTSDEIFRAFLSDDPGRAFFHGHSFTANPISCAAACASLALLDDHSAQRRRSIESAHHRHLSKLSTHPLVLSPRVVGTIAAFDAGSTTDYLHPLGLELRQYALQQGVLIRPLGNVVYILPPYCISEADLELVYATITAFLERV